MYLSGQLKSFTDVGDSGRVAMILQADASIKQKANWFSLEDLMGDKSREEMTAIEGDNYDSLMKNLTNANTVLISNAADTLTFNSIDQLDQGAGTLYTITSQLTKGGDVAKTLDMKGRNAAVKLIEKMNDGFKKVEVADPSKLTTFIEGTSGSVLAILSSLNNILYSNDPDDIPLTDIEDAASLPYDTDIPEDGDAAIPDDPTEAFKQNAMKVTRLEAVKQVKSMVNLVEDLAQTTLTRMVAGEELNTKSPLGVSMKFAKLSGANTIGKDVDGDGLPDMPLVYDMEEGSRIEFPLNFCPGKLFEFYNATTDRQETKKHVTPNHGTHPCVGQWGIALKEWQVIKLLIG